MVMCLYSMCKVLGPIPSTIKEKEKRKRIKKKEIACRIINLVINGALRNLLQFKTKERIFWIDYDN